MTEVKHSDYEEVVEDVAVQLSAQLKTAESGSVIDMFLSDTLDPAEQFLFYGALEQALLEYRKGHNQKTVFIRLQPEGLATNAPVSTPASALLDRILLRRMDEFMHDKLFVEEIFYYGEHMVYSGLDLKNRHVVILTDGVDEGSPYLAEAISMCKEMKAKYVVGLPMMIWSKDLQAHLAEEDEAMHEDVKGMSGHENTPVS